LSFKATTSDIREYFGTFGPLELAELKTEDTGQIRRSKGFAFIKFKDLEVQEKVLLTRHSILDRWCDVKMSESALKRKFQHESDEMFSKNQRVDDFDGEDSDESDTCDLIVLGLSFKATANDIREYFETYGPLDLVELMFSRISFAVALNDNPKTIKSQVSDSSESSPSKSSTR
jgi:RNA recognition motif-containing protein